MNKLILGRFTSVMTLTIAMLMAIGIFATAAYAGSAFSNAKAEFAKGGLAHPDVDEDANGKAIINYVKGQQAWNVSGKVSGLLPNEDYKVQVGTAGVPASFVDVAEFTTDADGNASFNSQHVEGITDEYTAVRVIAIDAAPNSPDLNAREDGNVGSLEFRGTGRGQ